MEDAARSEIAMVAVKKPSSAPTMISPIDFMRVG
jgi:hypothetical protein